MPKIDCQACGAKLWVSWSHREPTFTCPRCLAAIPVPRPGETPAPEAPPPGPTGIQAGTAPTPQFRVEFDWDPERFKLPDRDVQFDLKGTAGGLALLAGLALLGLITTFSPALESGGQAPAAKVFIVCLGVLFACGLFLTLSQESAFARQIGRGILSLFGLIIAALVGVVALIVLLGMVCKALFG